MVMLRLTSILALGVCLVAGCAAAKDKPGAPPSDADYGGVLVNPPLPKIAFTLADTDGKPYRFKEETEGYITLLFFGYTHCPDVCPVHMANIASALHHLGPEIADRVKVVFVTTDPDRDTADRLRSWLDALDPRFIGLRGSEDSVNTILNQLRLGAAFKEDSASMSYTVAHSAVVLAYTTDDSAHVLYPFGVRQADFAKGLTTLVKRGWSRP